MFKTGEPDEDAVSGQAASARIRDGEKGGDRISRRILLPDARQPDTGGGCSNASEGEADHQRGQSEARLKLLCRWVKDPKFLRTSYMEAP